MRKTMHNGICPKCQGREIYRVSQGGAGGYVSLGMVQAAPLTHLICTECGYVELYILETSQLAKVRKHGRRITGEDRDGQ
jgi:predicted nucleic-acid-binding Zn-ribbon protein